VTTSDAVTVDNRIGSFRYFRDDSRWEWSEAVARMHGYAPGQVEPTTALVMSHKHPDDAADVALLIEAMSQGTQPFSSRHRIIDTQGDIHAVLVIGEPLCARGGAVVGCQGFYVDLSDAEDDHTFDAAIADFAAHRAVIEQAKGILMVTYSISAERAFDILVWRSQDTNTKLRTLAAQIVADFTAQLAVPSSVRQHANHLLLTAHQRVGPPKWRVDPNIDAC
jgi:PAS domain S-box-containing protein